MNVGEDGIALPFSQLCKSRHRDRREATSILHHLPTRSVKRRVVGCKVVMVVKVVGVLFFYPGQIFMEIAGFYSSLNSCLIIHFVNLWNE